VTENDDLTPIVNQKTRSILRRSSLLEFHDERTGDLETVLDRSARVPGLPLGSSGLDALHILSPLGARELLVQAGFEIEEIWPGRGYHAFKSLPRMVFRRPFNAINPLIRLAHVASSMIPTSESSRAIAAIAPKNLRRFRSVILPPFWGSSD
jgi:hypothetical protein